MPILLYGLECFFLPKSDVKSLDFAVTRFLMKLLRTANNDVIRDCCRFLEFTLPYSLCAQRMFYWYNFVSRCRKIDNHEHALGSIAVEACISELHGRSQQHQQMNSNTPCSLSLEGIHALQCIDPLSGYSGPKLISLSLTGASRY